MSDPPAGGHVLARLSGFGMVLLPHWPYEFARVDSAGAAVWVTRWTDDGPRTVVVDGSRRGSVEDVVDVGDGREGPQWWIETSVFDTHWPDGFTVESPQDPADRTPFYLSAGGGELVYPQGPLDAGRFVGPLSFAAPGQTVVNSTRVGGVELVELAYEHDGEDWWQAHWVRPYGSDRMMVVTAQAPADRAAATRTAAATVVTTMWYRAT